MNYRHSYHAGNFADTSKHVVLIGLIKSLLQKENAFCYLDTHAGAGSYDLFSSFSQKNKEFEQGISKFFHESKAPLLIKEYLNCIQTINNRLSHSLISSLRYYPGSPSIAQFFRRKQDRLILTELRPDVFRSLRALFAADVNVNTQLLDGYQALKAFLPPKERRGLIFIDPPFERPDEFQHLAHVLPQAVQRFETGIFAIWYPIKNRKPIERFHQELVRSIDRPMLVTELSIYPEESPLHLNGSGMVIINPPWKFAQITQESLQWMWKKMSVQNQGHFRLYHLKQEAGGKV